MARDLSRTKAATIIDVAALAGVSRTTASDALRNNPKVSPATRERVHAAAQELRYRVNTAARSLRSAQTGTIGLHVPARMTRIDYYMQFAFGVLEKCAETGYDVMMITSDRYSLGTPPPRVDGVIMPDPLLDDLAAKALLSSDLAIVTLEYVHNLPVNTTVLSANHEGCAQELLNHFDQRGARMPGMLASAGVTDWGIRLQRFFREWCVARSLPVHLAERPFGLSVTEWLPAARDLLDTGVDAILCGSVAAANAACIATAERELTLGSDVLVASLVDSPELAQEGLSVTAVDLRPREAGTESVDLLLAMLQGSLEAGTTVPFDISVRYRTSTLGA